jgi:small subunit ribosomal protein S4
VARYIGPKCRLCRREGIKLFLKGTRCDGPSCAIDRRDTPPGVHNWRRGRMSDYGVRLREKQKTKRFYGVLEHQFRRYFRMAQRSKLNTGEELLAILESRLDNVVARLGMATSRAQARQMVGHGLVTVNGRKVNLPSYSVSPGEVIGIGKDEKAQKLAKHNLEVTKSRGRPSWLELEDGALSGKVLAKPTRDEVSIPIQEHLIIELMSK